MELESILLCYQVVGIIDVYCSFDLSFRNVLISGGITSNVKHLSEWKFYLTDKQSQLISIECYPIINFFTLAGNATPAKPPASPAKPPASPEKPPASPGKPADVPAAEAKPEGSPTPEKA